MSVLNVLSQLFLLCMIVISILTVILAVMSVIPNAGVPTLLAHPWDWVFAIALVVIGGTGVAYWYQELNEVAHK